MNFREQLSEAYKAGFNQGLQELQEGYHEGAHEIEELDGTPMGRTPLMASVHEMDHEEDEGYHEGEYEEQFGADPEPIDISNQRKALKRLFGKEIGGLIGDATLGTYSPLYGLMRPGRKYSGIGFG